MKLFPCFLLPLLVLTHAHRRLDDGGHCLMASPAQEQQVVDKLFLQRYIKKHGNRRRLWTERIPITTYIHVVHCHGTGNLDAAMIQRQIKKLDEVFSEVGYEFIVKDMTNTDNCDWHHSNDSEESDRQEFSDARAMKRYYKEQYKTNAEALHLYITDAKKR